MSEAPAPDVRQPTRRRRLWRWVKKWAPRAALAALAYVFVHTIYLVSVRQATRFAGNRELAAALVELDATDPDWTWERLNAARPRPPAGKNGAELISRFHVALPAGWRDGAPQPEKWQPDVPPLAPNVRLPARALKQGEAVLARVPEPLALARSLSDTPTGFREYQLKPSVYDTLIPDLQPTLTAALLLNWETELALEAGDRPRALVALRAQLNASRSLGDEPLLISQMVRIAIRTLGARSLERALAHTQFAEPDLERLQQAWTEDAEEPLLLYGLRGERAIQNELFRNLTDGTVTLNEFGGSRAKPSAFDRYANWLVRGRLPAAHARQLRWFDEAIGAARLPTFLQLDALPAIPSDTNDPGMKIAQLVLPAAQKVTVANVRGTADARCTVAALACERFRLKHGRFPDALAELVPALLPGVPKDAFTGEPLSYEKCEGGAIVFSVGLNRTDGPGDLDEPTAKPVPTGDPVPARFRLWNPDRRRLDPPPEPEPDANP